MMYKHSYCVIYVMINVNLNEPRVAQPIARRLDRVGDFFPRQFTEVPAHGIEQSGLSTKMHDLDRVRDAFYQNSRCHMDERQHDQIEC